MTTFGFIGASGAVGRTVIKQLLATDDQIKVITLLRRSDTELEALERCQVLKGGIFSKSDLDMLASKSDVMINLAARNPEGDEKDWRNRDDFFLLNGLGAGLAAMVAQQHQVPLIHFSSVAVYETGDYQSGFEMTEQYDLPAGEEIQHFYHSELDYLAHLLTSIDANSNDDLQTQYLSYIKQRSVPEDASIYGLSKLVGERLVLKVNNNVCCIRMSDAYGPGHESRGVIVDHLLDLIKTKKVGVNFDFRKRVYYLYIDDITKLLLTLTQRANNGSYDAIRVINFCGENVHESQFKVLLEQLAEQQNLSCDIKVLAHHTKQYDRAYSDALFSEQFTGFDKTSLVVGLPNTLVAMQSLSN